MEEGCGRTLDWSSPRRADRLVPEAPGDGPGLSAAPTPAMAGSASRISLAKDSASSPPPTRSSTSEVTGLPPLKHHSLHLMHEALQGIQTKDQKTDSCLIQ